MKNKIVYAYNLENGGGHCAAEDKKRLVSIDKLDAGDMDKVQPDCLKSGGRCYGLVFEQYDKVQGFILRMSMVTAQHCDKKHNLHKAEEYGDDWYSLSADYYEESKRDFMQILDECYDYTLSAYCAERGATAK